jgi:hypothetical protein
MGMKFTNFEDFKKSLPKPNIFEEYVWYPLYRFYDNWISPITYYYRIKNLFLWIKWGFNPRDLWNLDYRIAGYALPRIKKYKKIRHGAPDVLRDVDIELNLDPQSEEYYELNDFCWDCILECIIESFELLIKDDYYDSKEMFNSANAKIEYGLYLFGIYFRGLWD